MKWVLPVAEEAEYKTHHCLDNKEKAVKWRQSRDLLKSRLVVSVEDMMRASMRNHSIFTTGRSVRCSHSAGNAGRSLKYLLWMSIYSRNAIRDLSISYVRSAEACTDLRILHLTIVLDHAHRVLSSVNFVRNQSLQRMKMAGKSISSRRSAHLTLDK